MRCGLNDSWTNPCLLEEFKPLPFCDTSLPPTERATDMVGRIPDDEKVARGGSSTPLSNYQV